MTENQMSNSEKQQAATEDRKLFVGGLSWDTTEHSLREYFQKYGDIEALNIKMDAYTGKSRGFAFLSFTKAEAVNKILAVSDHVINNKKVDPKRVKQRIGKIFVGGLVPSLSNDDIKKHFSQYGTVIDMEIPFDKSKNQRKAFCFISFESEKVANDLLKSPKQNINGTRVDVKRVIVKPDNTCMRGGRGGRGSVARGRGGRGAGRGTSMRIYDDYVGYDQTYGAYGSYNYYSYGDYGGCNYGSYAPSATTSSYGRSGKQRGGDVRQLQRLHPY